MLFNAFSISRFPFFLMFSIPAIFHTSIVAALNDRAQEGVSLQDPARPAAPPAGSSYIAS